MRCWKRLQSFVVELADVSFQLMKARDDDVPRSSSYATIRLSKITHATLSAAATCSEFINRNCFLQID